MQISTSKRGLTPARLCAAVFCLLLIVGCVISPRRIVGGGGGGTPTPTPSPTPTPNPAATGKLYVSVSTTDAILFFDNAFTANGNATPAATITGAATTLNNPGFITLDPAADRLYVANTSDLSVLIFDNVSANTGTVNKAPNRTIAGPLTTLIGPTDVSFDRVRNQLYVADGRDIIIFGATALSTGGNVAPTRTLTTTFTLGISGIFLDAANDRLYAADPSPPFAINVYDKASTLASGPITPTRTITGAATLLGTPGAIQIDGAGRLVVSNSSPASITIYAAGASANQAPIAQIAGTNTGMSVPDQIAVNTSGTGSVYNADPGAARVAVFANLNSLTGTVSNAPARAITGLPTAGAVGVALDNTR